MFDIIQKTYMSFSGEEDERLEIFYEPSNKNLEIGIIYDNICDGDGGDNRFDFALRIKDIDNLIEHLRYIKREVLKDENNV